MMTKAKSTIFFSTFLVMLGVLLLSSCGYHYKCGVTFGSSTCTSSGSGIGTTGSSSGNTAFAYSIAFAGTVNGAELSNSNNSSLQAIPNFTSQTVPASEESAEIVVVPKKFVYAMFPSSQKLFAWSISAATGDLVSVSGSPFSIPGLGNVVANSVGVNYSSMAVNPAGTFLFFAYAGSDQIDAYQISSTGTLTQVSGAPFSSPIQPWNLAFDGLGNYLYVTSGMEGLGQQVAAFSIGSSGALSTVPGSPFSFNMWMLQGDPSGKYMIGISGRSNALNGFADDDSLYVFNIQQSGSNAGALTQVSGSPFATVTAPINLAVQPVASNGNFVYSFSINPLGPNPVEGYQLDTNSGTLTAMTGSPFSNLGTGYWGQFDQSGAYLFIFANTSTASSLGILSVASATGVLTEPLGPVSLAPTTYFAITDAP
jgi:hypothetical protein